MESISAPNPRIACAFELVVRRGRFSSISNPRSGTLDELAVRKRSRCSKDGEILSIVLVSLIGKRPIAIGEVLCSSVSTCSMAEAWDATVTGIEP